MFKHAPHIYRPASKGKPFTPNEKFNIILAKREQVASKAALARAIAAEREKIAEESAQKTLAAKKRHALLEHPEAKKILVKKDGTGYFQPRIGGRLGKAVKVF